MVLLVIVLYVAYVFRKVTKPVSSWKYGFATIIALAHDITVTLGVFALLGATMGTEIDTLFVTALLVILGYSVNDSIVVLDRVRENLAAQEEQERGHQFVATVGRSISETLGRSFNTSFTTLLALLALAVFGAEATRTFAIVLLVGIGFGTYSSICIASAILVSFFEAQKKQARAK
jgi:preprotein translocase subunit SecF